jgi:hypothetical protein
MAQKDTDEKNPCRAYGNALYFESSEPQAGCDDDCEKQNGMGYTRSGK